MTANFDEILKALRQYSEEELISIFNAAIENVKSESKPVCKMRLSVLLRQAGDPVRQKARKTALSLQGMQSYFHYYNPYHDVQVPLW